MELSGLLAHARPYRGRLALVALISMLGSVATLALPWLAGQLLGGALSSETEELTLTLGFLIAALIATTACNIASYLVSNISAGRILADLRIDIYAHVQYLPMTFHDQNRQGDLLALLSYEVSHLSQFIAETLANVPSMLLTTAGAVIFLFWIDSTLALLVPLLVPGFYLALKIIGRRLRGIAQARQKAEAAVMAKAEESLEMLPAIKAFAREEIQRKLYASLVRRAYSLSVDEARVNAILGPTISLIAALGAVALIVFASRNLEMGVMSPSNLFSFLLYAALLTRPVGQLAHLYGQCQTARGTLERLQSVLEEKAEPGYVALEEVERCRGDIAFHGVWFDYPGREGTIRGVDLIIRAGDIVALKGENGAGKSTLVKLLLNLYQPDQGRITLDGQDTAEIQAQSLRRQIGYVPQRPLLFNGTIRENISYGLEGADDRQVEAAARLSQAWEFISDLPLGLDTRIGDHGVRLSGGQRQRIALARALIKDPPILILDEATSMYDLDGEAAFIAACATALRGRTVIMITHRPASLALARKIMTVEKGKILGGVDQIEQS